MPVSLKFRVQSIWWIAICFSECDPESSSSEEFLIGPSHDAQDICKYMYH